MSDITTAKAVVESMSEDPLHQGVRAKLYFLHLVACKVACFVFQS